MFKHMVHYEHSLFQLNWYELKYLHDYNEL